MNQIIGITALLIILMLLLIDQPKAYAVKKENKNG